VIGRLEGYTSYRTLRSHNQASGVVAYVRNNNLNATVTEPIIRDTDSLFICVPGRFSVLGLYRSPSFVDPIPFVHSLESFVKNDTLSPNYCIVTGDINININSPCSDSCASEYICVLAGLGFRPAVDRPTRKNACLDHFYVRSAKDMASVVCVSDITDHDLVMVGITAPNKFNPAKPSKTVIRQDFEAIRADLEHEDW
jgi:hypothetical protein